MSSSWMILFMASPKRFRKNNEKRNLSAGKDAKA
jgi:hypothetical protein